MWPELVSFLDEALRKNERTHVGHFELKHMRVYVRVATRAHPFVLGLRVRTMDVGSIEVEPRHRGKGRCQAFLREWEQLAVERGCDVFVESVMSEALEHICRKRGYVQVSEEDNSYWLF